MTTDELADIVRSAGYACRVQKDEVQVEVCWFCSNDRFNLELNPTKGVFSCWACPARGRLDQLISDQLGLTVTIEVDPNAFRPSGRREVVHGGVPTMSAMESPSATAYLRRRGLPLTAIFQYHIGVCNDPEFEFFGRNITGWLVIPVLEYWTQEPAGVVARAYLGRGGYMSDTTGDFIGWRVADRTAPHVLVEGPFDAIAVHRAGAHAAARLGVRQNADPDALLRWVARVPPRAPLGIMYDGDASDRARADWWRARTVRPDVVLFPLPAALDPGKIGPAALGAFILKHVRANATGAPAP